MKKRVILVLLCLAAVACVGLVGCSNHQHTFATNIYEHDEQYHWHPATCEHENEKSGLEEHSIDKDTGRCVKCGYNPTTGETYLTLNNTTYRLLADGTYELIDCQRITETTITIPAEVGGRAVTSIATGAFKNVTRLQKLVMPDTVTVIASRAFASMSKLSEVQFSQNLRTVGEYAFENCGSLGEVTLPVSLKTVPYGMFSGCSSLAHAELGAQTIRIGGHAFDGCSRIDDFEVPSTVIEIGDAAFINCVSLKSIVIPAATERLGESAFEGCSQLTSATLGEGLTYIGASAFKSSRLTGTVTIPDKVEAIGASTFEQCSNLTEVKLGSGIRSIGERAFYHCTRLSGIVIPDNVRSIGDEAFFQCENMQTAKFGDNIETIGAFAFAQCAKLEAINLGSKVTELGEAAFAYCGSVMSIIVPDSVEYFGSFVFSLCSKLVDLTVPFIGSSRSDSRCIGYLFDDDQNANNTPSKENATLPPSLKTVTVTSAETIADEAFLNCKDLEHVYLPDALVGMGDNVFGDFRDTSKVKIQFTDDGSAKYIGSKTNPHLVLVGADSTDITSCSVNENTKIIMGSAFKDCSSLTEIQIPDGVINVGFRAFLGCPDELFTIESNDYKYLGGTDDPHRILVSATLSATTADIDPTTRIIAGGAFYGSKLTELNITTDVSSIGNKAFARNTRLTKVVLPESVIILGSETFEGCSALVDVTVPGNVKSAFRNLFSGCRVTKATVNAFLLPMVAEYVTEVVVPSGEKIEDLTFDGHLALERIKIGDSVKYIGRAAFQRCLNLESVTFSSGLVSIGKYAFYGCGELTGALSFGDSLKTVGEHAFEGCGYTSLAFGASFESFDDSAFTFDALDSLTVSNDNENFRMVDGCMIDNDGVVVLGMNNAKLPTDGSVTAIGNYAFHFRKLGKVVITTSVTSIGDGAFAAIRPLEIEYKGTIDQWNAISKGSDWLFSSGDEVTNEVLVRCTDGNVIEGGGM